MLIRLLFGDVMHDNVEPLNNSRRASSFSDLSNIVRTLGAEDYRDTHDVIERVIKPAPHWIRPS